MTLNILVSELPFGFGPSDRDPQRRDPDDQGGGPDDLLGKMPLFAELQKLMSGSGGPVNWDLARQGAIAKVSGGHVPISAAERTEIVDALTLADLWLGEVTDFPSGITSSAAWSRVDWIEKTLPVWSTLCDPVATQVSGALSAALPGADSGVGLPPQVAGQMGGMLKALGGIMFGAQVGESMASLSAEVLTGTDIGLPLAPPGTAVLIPQNITAFSSDLDVPIDQIRLFLALREAAHQRLFAHVPWLRARLLGAVEAYARGITIDVDSVRTKLEETMGSINPQDPAAIQEALSSGLFTPEETPEQVAALARLETLLALIEGWVDCVVSDAAGTRLPSAMRLTETFRRRRAAGGPAEQAFGTLIGLELRPRRLHDAVVVWNGLVLRTDASGRDRLWGHPDLLPTAEDLDDPEGFVDATAGAAETDWSIDALGTAGPAPSDPESTDPADSVDPDDPAGPADLDDPPGSTRP